MIKMIKLKNSDRMLLRNSRSSVLRTPLKSSLFFLVIAAVTAFVYLGVNIWGSGVLMLKKCDADYSTIAVFGYDGTASEDYSVGAAAAAEKLSAADIAKDDRVINAQLSVRRGALIEGYNRRTEKGGYYNRCVLIVKGVYSYTTVGDEEEKYMAQAVAAPYSSQEIVGMSVVLLPGQYEQQLVDAMKSSSGYLIVHGEYYTGQSSLKTVRLCEFSAQSALDAGFDCGSVTPVMQLSGKTDSDVPQAYRTAAQFYAVTNNLVTAVEADDISSLEYFHQKTLFFNEGGGFTDELLLKSRSYCIISQTVANQLGVKVGDKINLSTVNSDGCAIGESYWPGNETAPEEYEICGITGNSDGMNNIIFIPFQRDYETSVCTGHTLLTVRLDNGSGDEFIADYKDMLPENVSISVYDRGYKNIVRSIDSILVIAKVITLVSVVAAAAVLMLFAYLFVTKQRETVVTMGFLGTRRSKITEYLLFGCGILTAAAAAAGVVVGRLTAGGIISAAYYSAMKKSAAAGRFSNSMLGVTDEFTPMSDTSVWFMVCTALGIIVAALLCCMLFAQRTMRPAKSSKQRRMRTVKPPKKSSAMSGGALKYTLLSMRRGGVRTLIVPFVSIVMVVFLCTLGMTQQRYAAMLERVYDEAEISGRFCSLDTKYTDSLGIDFADAARVMNSGYVEGFSYTISEKYYLPEGGMKDFVWPTGSYAIETLKGNVARGSSVVFTNSIASAPQFYGVEDIGLDFASGWEQEGFFGTHDWKYEIPCVISDSMQKRLHLANGASFSLIWSQELIELKFVIAGTYSTDDGIDNIYCPLPEVYTDITADFNAMRHDIIEKVYETSGKNGYEWGNFSDAATLGDVLLMQGKAISSASFRLKSARELSSFKQYLQDCGFSTMNRVSKIRSSVMLDDRETMNTVTNLSQQIGYMNILLPALYLLTAILGFTVSYLMINSRADEITTMRCVGAKRRRVFVSFFAEQLILCIFGAIIGQLIMAAVSQGITVVLSGALYALFYIIGSAVSTAVLTAAVHYRPVLD